MCDIWRGEGRQELAVADVARWVAEWRELGVERVVLSGGEALMHSRLWELCDLLAPSTSASRFSAPGSSYAVTPQSW